MFLDRIQRLKHRLLTGLVSGVFMVATCLGLMPAMAGASSSDSFGGDRLVTVLSGTTQLVTDTLTALTDGNLTLDANHASSAENRLNLSLDDVTVDDSNGMVTCTEGEMGVPPHCLPARTGSSDWPPLQGRGVVKGAEVEAGKQANASAVLTVHNKLIAYTKAVIHVASKEPTKVYLRFGANGTMATITQTSDFAKVHDVAINPKYLVPGRVYSYVVVSTTKDGTKYTSPVRTFTTKGFTVYVTVLNKNHQPLRHKPVTLHSTPLTAMTDSNGVAKFHNVAPGTHRLEYMSGDTVYSQKVGVANNVVIENGKQIADIQHVSVVYDFDQSVSPSRALWSLIVAGAAIVLALLYWVWHRLRMRRRARRSATWKDKAKVPVYAAEPKKTDHT